MLPKKLPAKIVYQIVRTKHLCEKAFEKLSPKMVVLKRCPKCLREDSRSKCPYRTASWKIFRGSYHQKRQFWKAAQNFIRKNSGVAQNVRSGILAEKSVRENYHWKWPFRNASQKYISKNSGSKCPYRNASWKGVRESYHQKWQFWKSAQNFIRKTVVQNDCIEILAENCPKKNHWKWPHWNAAQKVTRKNSCSNCPYQNSRWRSVRKTTTGSDRTEMLPKMYPQKQSFDMSVPKFQLN